MNKKVLSVVIPAYNEERYIGQLLETVQNVDLSQMEIKKEIIVVDDCSTDRTREIVEGFENVIIKSLDRNSGKGTAVKVGLSFATGDYIIIQDADLEYDPNDYFHMLQALLLNSADVIYGSRYMRYPNRGKLVNIATGKYPNQSWLAYLGGQSLSFVALISTKHYLTDTVTALKLFKRDIIKSLDLQTTGFELDHEISSKVLARGHRIKEVPISYFPRGKEEGKKIGLRDWFIAIRTFFRYRNG